VGDGTDQYPALSLSRYLMRDVLRSRTRLEFATRALDPLKDYGRNLKRLFPRRIGFGHSPLAPIGAQRTDVMLCGETTALANQ